MSGINTSRNHIAIAEQTDEVTPAAKPAFIIPLMSGALPTVEKTHEETRETHKEGAETALKEVKATAEFNCFAYEELMPLLTKAILGSDVTTTVDTLKSHLLTAGATVPRLTVWTYIDNGAGGYDITRHDNVLITSLTIKADDNGASKLEVKGEGTNFSYVDTVDTASAIDLAEPGHAKLITAGATAKFSGNSQNPVVVDGLTTVELELSRDSETTAKFGSPFPAAIDAKFLKCKPKIEMRGSQEQCRIVVCGSASATSIPVEPVYGSTEVKLPVKGGAAKYLIFVLNSVVWKASSVEADPEAGKWNMSLEGDTDSAIPTITSVTAN